MDFVVPEVTGPFEAPEEAEDAAAEVAVVAPVDVSAVAVDATESVDSCTVEDASRVGDTVCVVAVLSMLTVVVGTRSGEVVVVFSRFFRIPGTPFIASAVAG